MRLEATRVQGLAILASALLVVGATPNCWGETSTSTVPQTALKLPTPDPPAPRVEDEHPLRPVLRTAIDCYSHIRNNVDDYTCIMVRRERINGRLGPHEFIYAKVRHRRVEGERTVVPFSVYMKFLKPRAVVDREVLYVEGKNDGEMFARRGGTRFAFVTTRLDPLGNLAMRGNRHPVTEFGIENLLDQLIVSARRDLAHDCSVEYLQGAKINGRPALGIVVTQLDRDHEPEYYQTRIFVDRESNLPIHYEGYDWPKDGKSPQLLEQYTYTNVQTNVGLNDVDFSEDNPQYRVK